MGSRFLEAAFWGVVVGGVYTTLLTRLVKTTLTREEKVEKREKKEQYAICPLAE